MLYNMCGIAYAICLCYITCVIWPMQYNICYIASKPRLYNTEIFVLLQYLRYITKSMLYSTFQPSSLRWLTHACRSQVSQAVCQPELECHCYWVYVGPHTLMVVYCQCCSACRGMRMAHPAAAGGNTQAFTQAGSIFWTKWTSDQLNE